MEAGAGDLGGIYTCCTILQGWNLESLGGPEGKSGKECEWPQERILQVHKQKED